MNHMHVIRSCCPVLRHFLVQADQQRTQSGALLAMCHSRCIAKAFCSLSAWSCARPRAGGGGGGGSVSNIQHPHEPHGVLNCIHAPALQVIIHVPHMLPWFLVALEDFSYSQQKSVCSVSMLQIAGLCRDWQFINQNCKPAANVF